MIIETSQLRQSPRRYAGEDPADILALDGDKLIRVESAVRYALAAQRFSTELLVCGSLEVDMCCRCARCGEFFAVTIREGNFTRSYPLNSDNELIDLTADIREAMLLLLPMNMVCSTSCKGLCVQCGANLNKAPCACAKPRQIIPWGMLDQLKIERK